MLNIWLDLGNDVVNRLVIVVLWFDEKVMLVLLFVLLFCFWFWFWLWLIIKDVCVRLMCESSGWLDVIWVLIILMCSGVG